MLAQNPATKTSTTTTSTAYTTDTATTSTIPALSTPNAPTLQSKPLSDRAALIEALLNEQKTGVPPLHQAIIDGDYEMAKALLASGAWVRTEIRPPLAMDPQLTATLFSLGRPQKFRKTHGKASAHVRNRSIVDLAIAMQLAAPKQMVRNAGANALTLALLCNAPLDFVEHLMASALKQYQGILDQNDATGRTPMSIAIENADTKLITLLLTKGACRTSEEELYGYLNFCIQSGHPELLALFLDVSDTSKQAVLNVIRGNIEDLMTRDFTALSRLLKAVHFFLDDRDIASLLTAAAEMPGSAEILPLLYGLLRRPMTTDQLNSLREFAAASGDLAVYRYVRQRDHYLASVLRLPTASSSPLLKAELLRALRVDDEHFVQLLLKKGVDIALDEPIAEDAGLKSIAAKLRDPAILNRLSKGMSIGGRPGTGKSAGFDEEDYDAVTSEEAFMRMLMADGRVQDHPSHCVDILRRAVHKNYELCVDYLLQRGTPAHDHTRDGWASMQSGQPLAIAIKNDNVEITAALLKAGAVATRSDISNARYSENPEMVRLFSQYS